MSQWGSPKLQQASQSVSVPQCERGHADTYPHAVMRTSLAFMRRFRQIGHPGGLPRIGFLLFFVPTALTALVPGSAAPDAFGACSCSECKSAEAHSPTTCLPLTDWVGTRGGDRRVTALGTNCAADGERGCGLFRALRV